MSAHPPLSAGSYVVGIICALKEEKAAMVTMLDETHDPPQQKPQDDNNYTFGRIFRHNVVIACLPGGFQGKAAATAVAMNMMNSFPIKLGLMVGIGGGVPSQAPDIHLGDVVVSLPRDTHGGVVQYDLGKLESQGFRRKGHLDKPPRALLSAIQSLEAKHETEEPKFPSYLSAIERNSRMARKYGHQGLENDYLFSAQNVHPVDYATCEKCVQTFQTVERPPRNDTLPQVFYGTIGSGDMVMKNGKERDERAQIDKVICFEMEAAGLMNHFPCLIIRGISDYADSHKNDRWQPYAAATAAAYAKELLSELNVVRVEELLPAYEEIQRWMSPINVFPFHEHIRDRQVPGTGQWLLEHEVFERWKSSESSSILLVHGIPGCGKTMLSSAVIEMFRQERRTKTENTPFAFFYCSSSQNEPSHCQPRAILRCITRQLTTLSSRSREVLSREYQQRQHICRNEGIDMTDPRISDCERLIEDVLKLTSITIVIDALDEVDEATRYDFLAALRKIGACTSNVAKIFITSRYETQIFALLAQAQHLRIGSQDNRADLRKFTTLSINRLLEENVLKPSPLWEEQVIRRLLELAGEMFQWIAFQLNELRLVSDGSAKDVLARLPTTRCNLDEIYERMARKLSGTENRANNVAFTTISWLLYAEEPLSPDMLKSAIKFSSTEQNCDLTIAEVLADCLYLVVYDQRTEVFRIAHISIREFLQRHGAFTVHAAHGALAEICLKACNEGHPPHDDPAYPLYRYCAMYWPSHYKNVNTTDKNRALRQEMRDFMYYDDGALTLSFCEWLEACNDIATSLEIHHPQKLLLQDMESSLTTPFFAACIYGVDDMLAEIAQLEYTDIDWNQTTTSGRTGLYLASAFGNESVAKFLGDHKADPNVFCGKHGSALAAACYAGHSSIARYLLTSGASTSPCGVYENALEAAAQGDQEEIALLLLESVYTKLDQAVYDQASLDACKNGWMTVLTYLSQPQLIESNELDLHCHDPTRIRAAIRRGQTQAVDRQLSRCNSKSLEGLRDCVSYAVLYRRSALIDVLLKHGFDMEYEGDLGSALRIACLLGHLKIADDLIDKGAIVDACGKFGTALQAAAMKGRREVTQLLLDRRADPNVRGGQYGTALQAASYHGHIEVVCLLLDAGAKVKIRGFFKDAVHSAIEGGQTEVLEAILLRTGYKMSHITHGMASRKMGPPRYRQVLRDASPSRSTHDKKKTGPIFRYAEDASGDFMGITSITGPGLSPLTRLETDFCSERILNNKNDNCALLAAASKGYTDAVKLLLEQRKALDIHVLEVDRAFEEAATQGHTEIVQLYLNEHPDGRLLSTRALELAASRGHIAVVEAILASSLIPIGIRDITAMMCSPSIKIVAQGIDLGTNQFPESDFVDSRNQAVVEHATRSSSMIAPSAIKLLLSTAPETDDSLAIKAFRAVCVSGNEKSTRALWRYRCQDLFATEGLETCLTSAASHGNSKVVRFLLEETYLRGFDDLPQDAIINAAGNGHAEVVKQLHQSMKAACLSHETLNQALLASSSAGHVCIVNFLLANGAHANSLALEVSPPMTEHGRRARRLAYDRHPETRKHINALQACLQGFERFTPGTSRGYSWDIAEPSLWQEKDINSQNEVLIALLHNKADPNSLGGARTLPLVQAASFGSAESMTSLLTYGAMIDIPDIAIHSLRAAAHREVSSLTLVKVLLDAGMQLPSTTKDVNPVIEKALNYFGDEVIANSLYDESEGCFENTTSLGKIFDEGPGAVVELLLAKLPHERTIDVRYGLILQMASRLGRHSFVQLLLRRGVNVNTTGSYYGTALQAASRCGHLDIMQLLMAAGAEVNILHGRYHTALRAAAVGNHVHAIQVLLGAGADPALQFTMEPVWPKDPAPSLLQIAMEKGDEDVVNLVLETGIEISQASGARPHPLIRACELGSFEIVQSLVSAGVPVDLQHERHRGRAWSIHDHSPLHKACFCGHDRVVQLLLDRGARGGETEDHWTPLAVAAYAGHASIVRLLLRSDYQSSPAEIKFALREAAVVDSCDVIEVLLSETVHTGDIWSALEDAISRQRVNTARQLVTWLMESERDAERSRLDHVLEHASEQGEAVFEVIACFAKPSLELITLACRAGSSRIVQSCLDRGLSLSSEAAGGHSGLCIAAYQLHVELVELLLSNGALANSQDPLFGNPLLSTLEGCLEVGLVRLHRSLGQDTADLKVTPPRQRTRGPDAYFSGVTDGVNYAESSRCVHIVRRLLDHCSAPDESMGRYGNALHLAAYMGNRSLVELLLERNADINACGGYFHNALFAALEGNNPDVAMLLVNRHINVGYAPCKKTSPLHLACEKGMFRTVDCLLKAGADVHVRDAAGKTLLCAAFQHKSNVYSRNSYSQEAAADRDLARLQVMAMIRSILHTRETVIGANDLVAASKYSLGCLVTLLNHDKSLQLPEEIVLGELGTRYVNLKHLDVLLEHTPHVTKAMIDTVRDEEVMGKLLRHPSICEITTTMIESKTNWGCVKRLLQHAKNIRPGPDVVLIALNDRRVARRRVAREGDGMRSCDLDLLWTLNPDLVVNEDMIASAISPDDLEVLLQHSGFGLEISDEVIREHCSRGYELYERLCLLLLEYGKKTKIGLETVVATISASKDTRLVRLFFEHNPQLVLTEEIFLAAFEFSRSDKQTVTDLVDFLRKRGKSVVFTARMHDCVMNEYPRKVDTGLRESLFSLEDQESFGFDCFFNLPVNQKYRDSLGI